MTLPTEGSPFKSRFLRAIADLAPNALLTVRGATRRRRVALTFDDGPDELTRAYLDVLARRGVRATFFLLGRFAVERRDDVLAIARAGHEIGSHAWSHRALPRLPRSVVERELEDTGALLPPTHPGRRLLRPPGGAITTRTLVACALAGWRTVHWSLDSEDARLRDADAIAARVAPSVVRPGDIVLLHEAQPWTLAALPRIVDGLLDAGWALVPLGELDGG